MGNVQELLHYPSEKSTKQPHETSIVKHNKIKSNAKKNIAVPWNFVVNGYIRHEFLTLFTNNKKKIIAYEIIQMIIDYCLILTFVPLDVHSNASIMNNFSFIKNVGNVSTNNIFQSNENGKQFVVKVCKLTMMNHHAHEPEKYSDKKYIQNMFNRRIISDIEHPFIISLHYAFQIEPKIAMRLFFDAFVGKELQISPRLRMSIEQSIFYSAQIFLALKHLHANDIILCDLSLENIMLCNDNYVRIIDHKIYKESIIETKINSRKKTKLIHSCNYYFNKEYAAPEIFHCLRNAENANSEYFYSDEKFDWWSFGVLLYLMLTGETPISSEVDWNDKNMEDTLIDKMLYSKIDIPMGNSSSSDGICSLLEGLLNRNIQKRFNVNNIESHEFYKNIDWDRLYLKEIVCPTEFTLFEKHKKRTLNDVMMDGLTFY